MGIVWVDTSSIWMKKKTSSAYISSLRQTVIAIYIVQTGISTTTTTNYYKNTDFLLRKK